MAQEISDILNTLGLSQTDVKIYQYLLKHGSATAPEIHEKSGIPLSTVYNSLESFRESRIISYLESKPHKRYILESPRTLERHIETLHEKKVKKLEKEKNERLETLKKSLHKLSLSEHLEKPQVKYYEGIEGIAQLRKDVHQTEGKRFFEIFNADEAEQVRKHLKDHLKGEIKMKDAPSTIFYHSKDAKEMVPPQGSRAYPLHTAIEGEIIIFGDSIFMIDSTSEKKIGIKIKNKRFADILKTLFELAEKQASREA